MPTIKFTNKNLTQSHSSYFWACATMLAAYRVSVVPHKLPPKTLSN